jgi:thiamine-monophosphate kinase
LTFHAIRLPVVGEFELIAEIRRRLAAPGERVVLGPGDDASVVRARALAITSVDTVVEGVHFDLATHSPSDVGHKALAAALSDLAAMGADPGEAWVALVLPPGFAPDGALELADALAALAERTGVTLAGGDVSSGPALVVSVTVTGWADRPEEVVGRGGCRPGDLVGVTGELGGSGAGLLLLTGLAAELPDPVRAALLRRHRRPEPRLEAGRALAGAGASAMIDLSDGLAGDARQLAAASGVSLDLELGRLPVAPGVVEVARAAGRDPLELTATAGDDYELLVAAPPQRRAALERVLGTPLAWLGHAGEGPAGALTLRHPDGRAAGELRGFEHA